MEPMPRGGRNAGIPESGAELPRDTVVISFPSADRRKLRMSRDIMVTEIVLAKVERQPRRRGCRLADKVRPFRTELNL